MGSEVDLAQGFRLSTCRPALVLALTSSSSTGVCLSPSPSHSFQGLNARCRHPEQVWPGKAVPGDQQHQRGWDSGPDPAAGHIVALLQKQGHQRQQPSRMAGGQGHLRGTQTSGGHFPASFGKTTQREPVGRHGCSCGWGLLCRSRMGMKHR